MVDLPGQQLDVGRGDPEPRLRQVTDDPDDAILVDAPAVAQLLEPSLRALADEHVDGALTLEQQLDEVASDESCGSGDEVGH